MINNKVKNNKLTVLVFISNYLPGYKSGGPMRTISNMVEHLGDLFNFLIITGDRDIKDTSQYQNIKVNGWNKLDNYYVYYLSPEAQKYNTLKNILNNTNFDILYLNSFFSFRFSILPILVSRLSSKHNKQIVLAPRGEFSTGALKLKYFKKILYIRTSSLFGLYEKAIFQASSDFEKEYIMYNLGKKTIPTIMVAPDLLPGNSFINNKISERKTIHDPLRLIFLSRISPMKNLEYALSILAKISIKIEFDIYGPIEDIIYWGKCQNIICNLPENINARYLGEVKHEFVRDTIGSYDLFFLPTAGENFGHVIFESLSAGTPVLISDTTPWRNLQESGVGWDIALSNKIEFINTIEKLSSYEKSTYSLLRKNAIAYANTRINDSDVVKANKDLFDYAFTKNRTDSSSI